MATIPQYVKTMRDAQWSIASKLGVDLSRADKVTRVLMLSTLAVLAVVVKTIVDQGLITDAQLKATLNTLRQATYTDEPPEPTGWDDIEPPT
jgi:hypothetical protein